MSGQVLFQSYYALHKAFSYVKMALVPTGDVFQ